MSTTPTIGWSDFARNQHTPTSGNSFTTLGEHALLGLVGMFWGERQPGHGEQDLSRKVVVPIPAEYHHHFCTPYVELTPDLPVRARVTQRQKGEDYYVETFVSPTECEAKGIALHRKPVRNVAVVCYSADALLENGGERSTDCEWEVVCILASENDGQEPMRPLTMARNQLSLPGGTQSNYTPEQFAEAVMYWSAHKGIKVLEP